MAYSTEEESNKNFNELLLQLDCIPRLAYYRNKDFNKLCNNSQNDLCNLYSALVRLKKLALTENHPLSVEINEFVDANFQLSQEFNREYNWKMKIELRLKTLNNTVKLYEDVINTIGVNSAELATKCNELVAQTNIMCRDMVENDYSKAGQLALKILGAVMVLAVVASLILLPYTLPFFVHVGMMPSSSSSVSGTLMSWYAPEFTAALTGISSAISFAFGGVFAYIFGDYNLQRKTKFLNVEDSVKKTTSKINLGLFKIDSSKEAIEPAEDKKSADNSMRLAA